MTIMKSYFPDNVNCLDKNVYTFQRLFVSILRYNECAPALQEQQANKNICNVHFQYKKKESIKTYSHAYVPGPEKNSSELVGHSSLMEHLQQEYLGAYHQVEHLHYPQDCKRLQLNTLYWQVCWGMTAPKGCLVQATY
jgi:hypothetical protein